MRSAIDIFRNLPIARDIAAREQFASIASVTIQYPDEFVEAKLWCRAKWEDEQQHYRIVQGSRRHGNGTFEFADDHHAVLFSLTFG